MTTATISSEVSDTVPPSSQEEAEQTFYVHNFSSEADYNWDEFADPSLMELSCLLAPVLAGAAPLAGAASKNCWPTVHPPVVCATGGSGALVLLPGPWRMVDGNRARQGSMAIGAVPTEVDLGQLGRRCRRPRLQQRRPQTQPAVMARRRDSTTPAMRTRLGQVMANGSRPGRGSHGAQRPGDKEAGAEVTGGHGGGNKDPTQRAATVILLRGEAGPATDSGRRLWCGWNQNTDVPVWRRFEKLSKQLDWDLQSRFEHVVLAGPDYLQALLEILDGIAGEKDVSEKRRVVRAALFEGQRRKDETLSQFAVRREQEFAGADRYLNIPSELKAFILEETAGLSKQGVQNLRTLTSGSTDFDRVVGALKTLDVEEEPLTKAKGSFLAGVTQDKEDPEAGEDDSGDDGEASPGDAAEVEAFLAEVTDVEESVALEMLAAFEKDGSGRGNQRRTWRQNKDRKLAARKDRRVFSKPRVSMSDLNLKERTRCANCGERGHWQAECRKPYRSKEERNRAEARNDDKGKRAVSFVYLGFPAGQAEGNTFVGWTGAGGREELRDEALDYTIPRAGAEHEEIRDLELDGTILRDGARDHEEVRDLELDGTIPRDGAEHEKIRDMALHSASLRKGGLHIAVLMALALDVFFAVAPGHAILDIGAAQDLIGEPAFRKLSGRLRKQGLRCLRLPTEPPAAHGVGGQATPLFQALVPCVLASVPGVVRVTVIKEDVPHLLSVGLLEATGAVIDMRRNTVNYKELGVSEAMIRMRSGHRVVDIASWEGTTYPVPPHLCKEYGLTDGAFNTGKTLTGTAVEVYMACAGIGLGSELHDGGALKPKSAAVEWV
eukprot:s466_g9.t1